MNILFQDGVYMCIKLESVEKVSKFQCKVIQQARTNLRCLMFQHSPISL